MISPFDRPVNVRAARIMQMGMTMVPFLFLMVAPFLVSILFAWRAWGTKPYSFWRPFTLASLAVAILGALYWPQWGGQWLIRLSFGEQFDGSTNPMVPLVYWTMSYLVWSVLMMPHTLARLLQLLAERNRFQTPPISDDSL